jgi:hypothetical protein
VRADTFLPTHMAQRCHASPLPEAATTDDALGSFWLCPAALRRPRPGGGWDVPAALVEWLRR